MPPHFPSGEGLGVGKKENRKNMRHHVNAISGRLSLRPPQRHSLEILDRVMEIAQPHKNGDPAAALEVIRSEFPTVADFEREFPSLCFALATGVGKTRLMGAFISYLHLAHGLNNFFVLAPNLTIYDKLIADFTPNMPKYVFAGIAEFAANPPAVITGDNYEHAAGTLFDRTLRCTINIFNISKINSEVRGGKSPRIKRLSEYIGASYFDYLAALPDLVMLMDESHRYRATAGAKAINELRPVLGLELTATPMIETNSGTIKFKNVIYEYSLAKALQDGFVKEPAVVTQKNFQPQNHSPAELERIKLEDGVRLHESVKVELETYARQTGERRVKPFMLIIARDTVHAKALLELMQSDSFFEGRYRERVIQVDSSTKGSQEDEFIARLLTVEHADDPTEIVIHVNMLKEGWDVTNLYTIVPLRAANARILIEQSIGRGLRLPYGRRTGVKAVDRLNIVAHDRFQEIVDEANRPDSVIRLEYVILDPTEQQRTPKTVISTPLIDAVLNGETHHQPLPGGEFPAFPSREGQGVGYSFENGNGGGTDSPPGRGKGWVAETGNISITHPQPLPGGELTFATPEVRQIARLTRQAIQRRESLPTSAYLEREETLTAIVSDVRERYAPPTQADLPGMAAQPDIAAIVAQTVHAVRRLTIDIPRIVVVPKGEVTTGFHPFRLETEHVRFQPVERDLLIRSLQTNEQEALRSGSRVVSEKRPEDYLVRQLIDFPDISYDAHADLLYELAGQMIRHLESYLAHDDMLNVAAYYQKPLAQLIHAQMQAHRWESAAGYDVTVTRGFMALKESAFTAVDDIRDFRLPPANKSNIAQLVFGGFRRCLYATQKFQSDTERRLAVILDRDAEKWFKPALGQFQIFYPSGVEQKEYLPDFVAETAAQILLLEPKMSKEMEAKDVLAKRAAAVAWCRHASVHALQYGGKPWRYALIPHDAIADNMTLDGLIAHFAVQ
ncbi:type III restriction enzyme, res subunit, putative [Candidatus Moduliflexus flocculans]|uniref:Type III restriction enzyme, res subunit, putative n=1 Tax=Candidatus Moduliflexus flocculans TaxID=1499966 RepID=A0A081BPW8_9BACT|nr:type III restriction enzyme, res subunit, putative [Candidatus Moduliflexus flocculans]